MEGNCKKTEDVLREEIDSLKRKLTKLQSERERFSLMASTIESNSVGMLQMVMDTIPSSVFWKDTNSTYLGCNKVFAADGGLQSPEDIVGKNDFELAWADQAEMFRADDSAVMTSGREKLAYEEELTTPDGILHTIETSKIPIRDGDGKVVGVLGTYQDITSRKNTENELKNHLEHLDDMVKDRTLRLKKLAELSMSVMPDADDNFSNIVRLLGDLFRVKVVCLTEIVGDEAHFRTFYAEGKLSNNAGSCPLKITPCSSVEKNKEVQIISGVKEKFPEAEFLKMFNAETYCGIPCIDSSGSICAVLCLLDDKERSFTDEDIGFIQILGRRLGLEMERQKKQQAHQKSEENLREAKNRLDEIFDTSPAITYSCEIVGEKILPKFVSSNIKKILGYENNECLNSPDWWYSNISPEDRDFVAKEFLASVFEGDSDRYQHEYRFLRKNGDSVWIRDELNIFRNRKGEAEKIVGSWIDITKQKAMEEELIKAEKLESVGQLAGGIAHDFNNVLSVVLNDIDYIEKYGKNEGEVLEKLQDAKNVTSRAKGLAHQLLTFSKGGTPLKKVLSIGPLAKEAVKFFLSGSSAIHRVSIPNDLWLVEVDESQMTQVFNNIVINSRQAMSDSGIVSVDAENIELDSTEGLAFAPGKYVKITISDNGPGIDMEALDKIFDPFFTTKEGGTGLGLSTSYSIVKKHGGYISASSEMGKGMSFDIYIPATDKEPDEVLKKHKKPVDCRGSVLLIDDEERLGKVVCDLLRHFGFECELALGGQDGIELFVKAKAAGKPFNAVVTDLTMPGDLGGKEVIARLLEMDPEVKGVVTSGYSNDPVMANYKDYGFMGVLPKPYTADELAELLRKIIS